MNNSLKNTLIFTVGATIGAATMWIFTKRKYEQIVQEEMNSIKEVFSRREIDEQDKQESVEAIKNVDTKKYNSILDKQSYTNYSDKDVDNRSNGPRVISPVSFGEEDDYDNISLTYYSDMILADDDGHIIDNVEEVIGFESLNHFGEYEDNFVFVRNDRLKCDYEVLQEDREYLDVVGRRPI